jgi:hypothetical protein
MVSLFLAWLFLLVVSEVVEAKNPTAQAVAIGLVGSF